MDSKTFFGNEQEMKNYQDLAAAFIRNVITVQDIETFIKANGWNRFDNISFDDHGWSINYSSFAIGYISFPVEKVSNYCYAKLVAEKLRDGFVVKEDSKPNILTIEKHLGVCEQDGNQLTNMLRCPSATALLSRSS